MATTSERIASMRAEEGFEEWGRQDGDRRPPPLPLYVSRQVRRAIMGIALERGCQPHDILIEAVELVLARYGRPSIRALSEDRHLQANVQASVATIDMLCEALQLTLETMKKS